MAPTAASEEGTLKLRSQVREKESLHSLTRCTRLFPETKRLVLQHLFKFLLIKPILFPHLNICFPGNLSKLFTLFFVSYSLHGYGLISKRFNVMMDWGMNLSSIGSQAMSRSWSYLGEMSFTGTSVPCKTMCSYTLISSTLSTRISPFSSVVRGNKKNILYFQSTYHGICLNFICVMWRTLFFMIIFQSCWKTRRNSWIETNNFEIEKKFWHVVFVI